MKKLVAIAAAVIAAVAIVVYFGRSPETTVVPMTKPEQPPTPTAPAGATLTTAGTGTPLRDLRARSPVPQQASTDGESSYPTAAPLTDEKRRLAECDALWARRNAREQAAIDAETKDPAWAYPMEQKLREFTSRRFQSGQIEVTEIDCKTSFCELRAQGLAPETADEFNRVMETVGDEPWNDFTGFSFSHTEEAGKAVHWARVSRAQPPQPSYPKRDAESEAVNACIALISKQGERERAARDAEPRDTSWADPTEQLLRQYLTEHTAKYPADRLEITCKTSFCKLVATGRTQEFAVAFQKAAQEVASEPWSHLRNGEGGGGTLPDLSGTQMYQVLYRNE
jgi:hypothetical protein